MIDKWRCNQFQYSNTGTVTLCDNPQNVFSIRQANSSDVTFTTSTISTSGSYDIYNNTDFENCSSLNYLSQQISTQDFTLLDMKYMQGYDYCEIGKEFNVSSDTVSNRVNYLKTKIKKSYIEELHD